jgi:hypothetical protein
LPEETDDREPLVEGEVETDDEALDTVSEEAEA